MFKNHCRFGSLTIIDLQYYTVTVNAEMSFGTKGFPSNLKKELPSSKPSAHDVVKDAVRTKEHIVMFTLISRIICMKYFQCTCDIVKSTHLRVFFCGMVLLSFAGAKGWF